MAPRLGFQVQARNRMRHLLGDMTDAADGKIHRPHASGRPDHAGGRVAFLRELAGCMQRVCGVGTVMSRT
jgi:hypothetical protein